MAAADFTNQILEGVNYIIVPSFMTEEAMAGLTSKILKWLDLEAEMHVLDFKESGPPPSGFYKAVAGFHEKLKSKNIKLISVNRTKRSLKR